MKCEKCNSSLIFIDAVKDKVWCKSCGYRETIDYRPLPIQEDKELDKKKGPIRLPTVEFKGKKYFVDQRLREFRTVRPPLEFIPFQSEKGRQILDKNVFDKIREQLLKQGWIEQECGTVYFNGEYRTNLYSKDESEVIHLSYNIFPDDELISDLKGEDDIFITIECAKCKKLLYRGKEKNKR